MYSSAQQEYLTERWSYQLYINMSQKYGTIDPVTRSYLTFNFGDLTIFLVVIIAVTSKVWS